METTAINKPKLIKETGMKYPTTASKKRYRYGQYQCPKCLSQYETQMRSVNEGKSTGCKRCASLKHGDSNTAIHKKWCRMKDRCLNKKSQGFKDYGGRGITIYEPWIKSFVSYRDYILSLPNVEKEGYSIDRFENDANYEPMNLRWVNVATQNRNTRILYKHNTSGYRGVSRNRAKWRAVIIVDGTKINIGSYNTPLEAGQAYDNYVIDNNLEHTINQNKNH